MFVVATGWGLVHLVGYPIMPAWRRQEVEHNLLISKESGTQKWTRISQRVKGRVIHWRADSESDLEAKKAHPGPTA